MNFNVFLMQYLFISSDFFFNLKYFLLEKISYAPQNTFICITTFTPFYIFFMLFIVRGEKNYALCILNYFLHTRRLFIFYL